MLELCIQCGRVHTKLIAHEYTTIKKVKEMIRDTEGTLCDERQLVYGKEVLEDGKASNSILNN
jgi:hypothetical protein